ncbi:hypothetical protein KR009_007443 [Drosophila setifemur]|nr:hypothetical protein KR009_007443 [Drosophila setifemur]
MLAGFGNAIPAELPRYTQLGQGPQLEANGSVSAAINQLGSQTETSSVSPDFEYSMLGQDPQDQHWFRVSLTPKTNKAGYRAQFATRKQPPFDEHIAHRHDKTIQDLLNWLERSEDQNLWRVYRDLLGNTPKPQTAHKFHDNNVLEIDGQEPWKKGCHESNHQLLLIGEEGSISSTTHSPTEQPSKTANNFVYFVKGLK